MYKIKFPLLLLVLIIAVLYFYKNLNAKDDIKPSISLQQTPENKPSSNKLTKKIKPTKNQLAQSSPVPAKDIPSMTTEFSSDPVVRKSIISSKYQVCEQYFREKIFLVKGFKKQFNSKIQQKYYEESTKNCEKLNSQHPEYGFSHSRKQLLEKFKIKATSKFGQLLEYNKIPYTHEDTLFMYKTIGRDYPDLINSPVTYKTLQYQIDVVNPDLRVILQTTNINYTTRVIQIAKNYLACDLGANCGNDSSMMSSYCRSEPNFCVNDFMTLFNTRLTSGVRSDVLLALPYIESLYQVD